MNSRFKKLLTVLLAIIVFMLSFGNSCFAAAAATTPKMTAHYAFDGDLKDSSGNGNDGKVIGDMSYADDGVIGKCAVFKDSYIEIPANSVFNLGKQFSISVWIKLDEASASKQNTILSRRVNKSDGDTYNSYILYTHNPSSDDNTSFTNLEFCDYNDNLNGACLTSDDSTDFSAGWGNIIYTCDGKHMMVYINGKLNGTKEIDGKYVNSNRDVYIGVDAVGGSDFFKGKMDDLRIYNYALSKDEINTINNVNQYSNSIIMTVGSKDMLVDGKKYQIDPGNEYVTPIIDKDSGSTLVPIRSIIENMGGTVKWNASDSSMNISLKTTTIWLQLNNKCGTGQVKK